MSRQRIGESEDRCILDSDKKDRNSGLDDINRKDKESETKED